MEMEGYFGALFGRRVEVEYIGKNNALFSEEGIVLPVAAPQTNKTMYFVLLFEFFFWVLILIVDFVPTEVWT